MRPVKFTSVTMKSYTGSHSTHHNTASHLYDNAHTDHDHAPRLSVPSIQPGAMRYGEIDWDMLPDAKPMAFVGHSVMIFTIATVIRKVLAKYTKIFEK